MTLATQVQTAVERYLSTAFTATTVTQVFDGGDKDLIVDFVPISSITSVTDTINSTVRASTNYSFYPDEGYIYLKDGSTWEEDRRKWSVEYIYGVSSIPEDVQLAIDTWVAALTADDTGSLKKYKTGDDEEEYKDSIGAMPMNVKAILDRYKGPRTIF